MSIPEKVRDFEGGVVDGLGDKGDGVRSSAMDKDLIAETKKKWAFNKVKIKIRFVQNFVEKGTRGIWI